MQQPSWWLVGRLVEDKGWSREVEVVAMQLWQLIEARQGELVLSPGGWMERRFTCAKAGGRSKMFGGVL